MKIQHGCGYSEGVTESESAPNGLYPVYDKTGEVGKWIERDGAVRVWSNLEIGSTHRDAITSLSQGKPHWRYGDPKDLTRDKILLLEPRDIVRYWSDSPQGNRAARESLGETPAFYWWFAPIGQVIESHSLLRFKAESEEKNSLGNPLFCHFFVGILRWSAILREEVRLV